MIQQSHSWASIQRKLRLKKTCTPIFTAALFTIAKTWKQLKCPSTEDWIKKTCICTREYYSAIKKNEMMPFAATWMDLQIIIRSEISQRQISYDINLYIESIKMIQMNLSAKQK